MKPENQSQQDMIGLDEGETIVLDAGQPFRTVISGELDVFIRVRDDNNDDIARQLLFPVKPGQLLATAASNRHQLIAVARTNADLSGPLESDRVSEKLSTEWCEKMLEGLTGLEAWQGDTPLRLEPGNKVTLSGGQRIRAENAVVWVRQKSGPPLRTGPMPLPEDVLANGFPVSRHSGLTAAGDVEIETFALSVENGGQGLDLLQDFAAVVLDIRARMVLNEEQQRKQRNQERSQTSISLFSKAISSFASVLGGHALSVEAEPLKPLEKAVAMIANVYDHKPPPHSIIKDNDISANALERSARSMRLRSCRIKLQDNWWKQDVGHLLAFKGKENTPVAILPNGRHGYLIFDGTTGQSRKLSKKDAKDINVRAYTLYPVFPDTPLSMKSFLVFGLKYNVRDSFEAFLMVFLAGALAMATPVLSAYIINLVVPTGDVRLLVEITAALLIALIVMGAVRYTSEIANLRIEGRVAGLVRAALIDRIIRMPANQINTVSTSIAAMQLSRLDGFRKSILLLATSSISAVLNGLFSLGVLFYFAPVAALVVLAMIVILITGVTWIGYRQYKVLYEGEHIEGNISTALYEAINNIAVLRAFGAEMTAFSNWAKSYVSFRHKMMNSGIMANRAKVLIGSYDIMITGIAFATLGLLNSGPVSTGGFLAFVAALSVVTASGLQLAGAVLAVFRSMPAARIAKPLLDGLPLAMPAPGPEQVPGGKIEVSKIYHRYHDDGPMILNGVDFDIEPQQYVAIVGPSGSGKSTLLKILLGLETPVSGAVYYDGQDLSRIDRISIRQHIGTVMQEAGLFPGSILENIRGGAEVSMDDVWEAAEMAAIADDIRAMPMALHTVITGADGAVSGGQAQRILIARALAAKPSILLFDEGTSALDRHAQIHVEKNLEELAISRIVIAHRMETVKHCDKIFVMDQGRIVDHGTFDELAARPGIFADLLSAQRGENITTA